MMSMGHQDVVSMAGPASLAEQYETVRAASLALAAPLSEEDQCVQSMPDASPTKWHLAHSTWFFEALVLAPHLPGYGTFDPDFFYLFNSYYEALGPRHPRPERGLLTRPSHAQVLAYRAHVDAAMRDLLGRKPSAAVQSLALLGLHHEQQHQELMLTDIKHLFSRNALRPAYLPGGNTPDTPPPDLEWLDIAGGEFEVGYTGCGFAFDNETPRHAVLLDAFQLASRPVTCGEYLAFMEDGGYARPELWLSDGWATVGAQAWRAPLYWQQDAGSTWQIFTLHGLKPLNLHQPVCHVSFYEAAAYASWANARLPTEFEWEVTAAGAPLQGHFVDPALLHPMTAEGHSGLNQIYGDVWEWTRSAYDPYPRFKPLAGAACEYNGKFMVGQIVLRGGSCATPRGHIRPTYRNFFPPAARWQFSGIRLARDP